MSYLSEIFNENGLTAHGFCLLWQPGLIWLHVASDTITGLSYYAIPLALGYFVWKRPDIIFGWMFATSATPRALAAARLARLA